MPVGLKTSQAHTNEYEHFEDAPKFFLKLFVYSLVGLIFGRLIEFIINQRDIKSKFDAFLAITFQLLIIFVLFYAFFHFLKVYKIIKFDDWLMNTFEGFFFALLFTSTQTSLSDNAKKMFI